MMRAYPAFEWWGRVGGKDEPAPARPPGSRWSGLPGLGLVVVLGGCQASPPPVSTVVDVKQLMAALIEPAAEQYWDAVGTVDDSTGSTSYGPRSAEDWALVRNAAIAIAESGNLLMLGDRAKDRDQWMTLSGAMIEAGREAIAAATAQDTARVFAAGGVVYEACNRCHATYATPLVRPNADPR